MHWLIEDRFDDPGYLRLRQNLIRLNVNNTLVKVIPFSDDGIESETSLEEIKEPIFVFGSHTLSKISKRRGYNPGAFISEFRSMDHLLKNYGTELLNSDMIIGKLSEIQTDMKEFYYRPMRDSKVFNAIVTTKKDFEEFKEKINNLDKGGYSTVTPDTMIIISSPKRIQQECRFFIVDSKIVTYSQYKIGETVRYMPVVDDYLIDYVNKIISIWEPDVAYCLDICVSEGEPKVLEVNSINSSGLYALDTQKFIIAINELTERYI